MIKKQTLVHPKTKDRVEVAENDLGAKMALWRKGYRVVNNPPGKAAVYMPPVAHPAQQQPEQEEQPDETAPEEEAGKGKKAKDK